MQERAGQPERKRSIEGLLCVQLDDFMEVLLHLLFRAAGPSGGLTEPTPPP